MERATRLLQGKGIEVGSVAGTSSIFEYDIPARSFFRIQTNGLMDNLSAGSVHITPFAGYNTPAAHAIVSDFVVDTVASETSGTTVGNTIFETSVEGQLPAARLRLYAEAIGDFDAGKPKSTTTAVAIANPSSDPVTVQLEVISFAGARLGISAPIQIPGNGQLSGYLQQISGLESLKAPFQGVVQVTTLSGSGVTAASFRFLRNERLDFLVTTTGPLNEDAGMAGRLIFPYLTDSTGYSAQFILINPPGAGNITGVLHFLSSDGTPLQIDTLRLGSVQIVPFAGFDTPHAHLVLNHRDGGVLTFITSIEGELPGRTFRMYAEASGDFDSGITGSTRSGVAFANPSDEPADRGWASGGSFAPGLR